MKKNKLLLNFIICLFGWGIPMGLLWFLMYGSLQKGLLLGFGGGICFALVMILFVVILSFRKDKLRKRYGIEGVVLYDGAANHMVNKEAVGGWIFLMEDRFCFVSHRFNINKGQWTIPYSDIADITKGKMIRSVAIHTRDGSVEELVVNNRKEWIGILREKCEK